ncbi:MAG: TIGR03617 family F420-dependent LLM class oxidoreductase [Proteobacteria bacterium]|nr:TIGR03617 family F420-dependent LLM class oxidoreductase [Pseudomonadota bacterium]
MAGELEEAGFDGAYSFEGQSDPFITIAAAAMKTKKMDLMTSIAVAFARNPMSLAYLGNDLQMLSGGRFILGLGTQVKSHVEHRFSMPWGKPVTRMREMVLAIKEIWRCWETGGKLKFEGEYYHHTLMNPTFSPGANPHGAPEIFLAGVGPNMTACAGEVADGYFVHPFHSARSFDELSLPNVQRGLDKAGKSLGEFTISGQLITATGLDDEQLQTAIGSARGQIAFYGSTPAYRPVLEVHGWEGMQQEWSKLARAGKWAEMTALVTDEILETFALVGTPEEVATKMKARCGGKMDRVSPVVYQPDTQLIKTLLQALKNKF